ncbi:MAG: GNAT family N-acetyltransferase [Actinomycetota bacterium]|nr:GNAT family N-acetyltransferase [Actinomycetota bacterium]
MSTVETERLVLRPWSSADVDNLAAVFAEPEVWRYPFGRGLSRAESEHFLDRQLEHWQTHGFGIWAAELKTGGGLIGYIGLAIPTWLPQVLPAVEVGWRLHPDSWGKGLATEGGRASLRYGFEALGLDRIISIFTPDNTSSGRVMDRLGMHDCLTTTDAERGIPLLVREITRSAWQSPAAGRASEE